MQSEQTFVTAGEVCFWKNYGSPLSRDRITYRLLKLLALNENWESYVYALVELSLAPSFENFNSFMKACGYSNGFAVPITFLAFYNPKLYPMVDWRIGDWWNKHKSEYWKSDALAFSQSDGRRLQPIQQNWDAYLGWADFCKKYSYLLTSKTGSPWRARDVEMAVWEAQKRNLHLDKL